jgi:trk system potassium uptake protein TrkA
VAQGSAADGAEVQTIGLPEGSLVISILRDGTGFVPLSDSVIEAGDEVLVVLDTGLEEKVSAPFRARQESTAG